MIARACRIYDKTSKQMLYPKDMARMGVFLDGAGEAVQLKEGWLSKRRIVKLKNVVVMYITGLATDTGKPIFEGDILDVTSPTEFGSLITARGYMQWDSHNGKWFVHIPEPPPLLPLGADFVLTGAQTVGDIYQHPDLLKAHG